LLQTTAGLAVAEEAGVDVGLGEGVAAAVGAGVGKGVGRGSEVGVTVGVTASFAAVLDLGDVGLPTVGVAVGAFARTTAPHADKAATASTSRVARRPPRITSTTVEVEVGYECARNGFIRDDPNVHHCLESSSLCDTDLAGSER